MSHVVFVTTELAPYTAGGAGVLVASLAALFRKGGDQVSIVLCGGDHVVDDDHVIVAPKATAPGWDFSFMDLSMAAAEALADLNTRVPVEAVEFQDFDGLAFWTLTHRRDLGFGDVPISVRAHGPVDLQIEAMGVSNDDFDVVAAMERESFRMADRVVVPSRPLATLFTARYELEPERVVVGPPIVRSLDTERRWSPGGSDFLVVGRLSEVKGSHDLVTASIPIMRRFPQATVTFVGGDGWSITTDQSMTDYLRTLVPADLADRFTFLPHADPTRIAQLITTCIALVVPSRFETFNLAAHEARALGAPVVAPSIPAFSDQEFERHGFLMYDGSVDGLIGILESIASDPSVAVERASDPVPAIGDPLEPYATPPVVRHERSQGGVATAALARVEAIRFDPDRNPQRSSFLRRILSRTPASVVQVLKPLVPRSVKGRIKTTVGWDGLVDERNWDDRWSAIESQSAAAQWPLDADPAVSVIIPCYNQGEYLRQAIISVFDQTYRDWEIIVVDDGSDDIDTLTVIDDIELDRVTVLRQDNTGLPGARNAGVRLARGDFVVALDADDLLDPMYLQKMTDALASDPDAAYAHCWAELFGDFHAIWATRPPNPYQLFLSNSVVGCVTLRTSAWAEVGGYDESMVHGNEDWDLWIRLEFAGYHGVQVCEPLFRYRKHGVSMSVETEGSYDKAVAELPQRLPQIYNRNYLSARKAVAYPMLSVLTPCEESIFQHAVSHDFERVMIDDDDVRPRLGDIRGKYSVVWPVGAVADQSVLTDLCLMLEAEQALGAAATAGEDPIVVVRTWSLFDPEAPQGLLVTGLQGSAASHLSPGQFPDDRWIVPSEIDGITVQRQRPEEAGVLPEWVPA